MMVRRFLILIAAAVVPLSLMAGPTMQVAVAQGTSTASLAPASGPAGLQVIGTGANWRPGDQIQAQWGDNYSNLGNPASVVSNGTFSVSFTIPSNATVGTHQVLFWDIQSRYFVVASFTVTQITVGQAVTASPTGQAKTSFIPGQGIWYGVIVTNTGSVSVSGTFTVKVSGPQNIFPTQTATAAIQPGTHTDYWPGTIPNLASFGTYTNTQTVVVGGQTYVRQSTFTVGDPRLANAAYWSIMATNRGFTMYNGWCEKAVEAAYSVSGVPPGYTSALADYQAQLAAGRVHSETDPNNSTAPRGALVFFTGSDPTEGHVGIAVGDGKNYWTSDGTMHMAPLTEGVGYKGWSLAPLSWGAGS
jgi:hypothetical protein